MSHLLVWVLTVQILGLAAFPLVSRIVPDLRDKGFAISKLVALSSLGLTSWLISILGISGPSGRVLLGITLIFICVSTYIGLKQISQILYFFKREWKLICAAELIYLVILGIFALFKFNDPSINHTEQPMDLAFLNAAMGAGNGGPLDPWMRGEQISYYYFGYWIFGNIGSLTFTRPEITYNLSLIFIPALMGTAVFGLASSLLPYSTRMRSLIGVGAISSVSTIFLSNLYGGLSFVAQNRMANSAFWDKICIEGLGSTTVGAVDSWRPIEFWWWFKSSRIVNYFGESCDKQGIDYTINEFPFFSYLLGDLHPHVMGGPFLIMFCALCLGASFRGSPSKLNKSTLSLIILIAISGATVSFVNMWSIPVVVTILLFIYLLRWISGYEPGILNSMLVPVGSIFFAAIFLSPFLFNFQSSVTGLQPSPVQTGMIHFLIVWGPLLILVVPYIVSQFWTTPVSVRWKESLLVASIVAFSPWIIRGLLPGSISPDGPGFTGVAVPITALIFICTSTAMSKIQSAGLARESIVLLLISLGLMLVLIPELIYVGDVYGNRMNIVFKFYYQAWILLAVSIGVIAHFGAQKYHLTKNKTRWLFRFWGSCSLAIILMAMYYAPAAIATKTNESHFKSFDGLIFLDEKSSDARNAINFARSEISRSDGLVEAVGEWGDSGIISMNTGIPSVINWPGHQKQWRGDSVNIEQRVLDVKTIYETFDVNLAKELLTKYKVKYIIVGPKEVQAYGTLGLSKFESMGTRIFGSQPNIEIYKLEN